MCITWVSMHLRPLHRCSHMQQAVIAPTLLMMVPIHATGPREELGYLPVFTELALLLQPPPSGLQLHLHMVGPDVPPELHGKRLAPSGLPSGAAQLQVSLYRGCYHELHASLPPAHLVVAPNAGLQVYSTWEPTLRLLLQHQAEAGLAAGTADHPLVLLTDHCEEAVVRAREVVVKLGAAVAGRPHQQEHESSGGGKVRTAVDAAQSEHKQGGSGSSEQGQPVAAGMRQLAVVLNPFRQPLRAADTGTALPACSNAFMLRL